MSLLWLWVALVLYSLGLVHAVVTVALRRERWFRLALGAFALGFLFHFVSLIEHGLDTGHFPVTNISDATSLFAFLITLGFLLGYWAYGVSSLSVFVFPFVFVMTLAAALSQRPVITAPPLLESAWVPLHVSFSLAGYAGMLLAFLAGVMYLFQERELKRKKPRAFYYRLPPLETIDHLGSVALGVGFPFITVGLLLGTANAARHWGPDWMTDPKILLSFLLWFIYLLLILARVSAGWRGRKAAIFSIVGMAMALASWGANYMNSHHTFLGR